MSGWASEGGGGRGGGEFSEHQPPSVEPACEAERERT